MALWSRLNAIGRPHHDRLASSVADILRKPGAQRERLFDLMHLPESTDEALGRVESALVLANRGLAVAAKIKQAMKEGRLERGRPELSLDAALSAGVITSEERDAMTEAVAARADAIMVDSFKVDTFDAQVPTPGFAPIRH